MAQLTIIDGYCFMSNRLPLKPEQEVSDLKCKECNQDDMPVVLELQQLGFDGHKSTVYMHCELCDRWYHAQFFVKYDETETETEQTTQEG